MAHYTITILALVAVSFTLCSASNVERSAGRILLAESLTAKGCTWQSSMCALNPTYALTLTAADDKAKLVKKISAMVYKCGGYNSSTTCNADTANNCRWDDYTSKCAMREEWTSVLVCPGTQAADGITCSAAEAKADCDKISTCSWQVPTEQEIASIAQLVTSTLSSIVKGSSSTKGNEQSPIPTTGACLPKSASILDYAKEAVAMMQSAASGTAATYSEETWGNCAGVQLMKALSTACSATTEPACTAHAGCVWSAAVSKCTLNNEMTFLLTSGESSSDFDKSMDKAAAACSAVRFNETACTEAGEANKGTFTESAITESLAFTQPAGKNGALGLGRVLAVFVAPFVAALLMLA